jgi:hypothetical protein
VHEWWSYSVPLSWGCYSGDQRYFSQVLRGLYQTHAKKN